MVGLVVNFFGVRIWVVLRNDEAVLVDKVTIAWWCGSLAIATAGGCRQIEVERLEVNLGGALGDYDPSSTRDSASTVRFDLIEAVSRRGSILGWLKENGLTGDLGW